MSVLNVVFNRLKKVIFEQDEELEVEEQGDNILFDPNIVKSPLVAATYKFASTPRVRKKRSKSLLELNHFLKVTDPCFSKLLIYKSSISRMTV